MTAHDGETRETAWWEYERTSHDLGDPRKAFNAGWGNSSMSSPTREELAQAIDVSAFEDHSSVEALKLTGHIAAIQWAARRKWALDAADAVLVLLTNRTDTDHPQYEFPVPFPDMSGLTIRPEENE